MKLVVGAGLIGSRVARLLSARGDDVLVATRSGTAVSPAPRAAGPRVHPAASGATAPIAQGAPDAPTVPDAPTAQAAPGAPTPPDAPTAQAAPGALRSIAVDASDAEALTRAAEGAETVFLVTNPAQYHRWEELWPPVFSAVIEATSRAGADLVVMGNLYAYGQATRMPMTEHSPLLTTERKGLVRKAGWERILEAHRRGDLRAVEVRASDYFGPGSTATAHLGVDFFRPLLEGRRPRVIGDPRAPHSWAYLDDIAATLVAAGDYTGEWGRAWHVPSAEPLSRVEVAQRVAALTGRPAEVSAWPQPVLRALGVFSPFLRTVADSAYQFRAPFLVDSAETERELGVAATPWVEALPPTLDSYRS